MFSFVVGVAEVKQVINTLLQKMRDTKYNGVCLVLPDTILHDLRKAREGLVVTGWNGRGNEVLLRSLCSVRRSFCKRETEIKCTGKDKDISKVEYSGSTGSEPDAYKINDSSVVQYPVKQIAGTSCKNERGNNALKMREAGAYDNINC